MTKKRLTIATIATAMFCGAFYFCCGLFIVHPLGASSDGSTYVYWRLGADLPFISSADGLLLEQTGSAQADTKQSKPITLATRGALLSQMSDLVLKRRILKLPYSRQLYLISSDGKELDNGGLSGE